jgi:hypothetical protein
VTGLKFRLAGRQYTLRAMTRMRAIVAFVASGLCFAVMPPDAAAHDVPNDVVVHAWIAPTAGAPGPRLRVLVRVPLRALLDIDFPTRGPGYLDLGRAEPALAEAATVWLARNLTIHERDAQLGDAAIVATRVSLPSDRSFASYDEALAHVTGPSLPHSVDIPWDQAMLDALLEYPIHSERSPFSVHPAFARLGLRVVTVLRFRALDGTIRAFEYTGDPGLVQLDPRWHQAAWTFVKLGCRHILEGIDHLLFVFCLVIPLRRTHALIGVITSFTTAHSITLLAAAAGLTPNGSWFPPLVEALIAASIVYMAIENIILGWRGPLHFDKRSPSPGPVPPGPGGAAGVTVARRWPMAFAFGLVHGFGFSFALRETLQFAGSHLLVSLLAFNVGVELGQLLALAVMVPAIALLFRSGLGARMGTIILSAFVAHSGWHWMTERIDRLRQFGWPALDAPLLASAMRVAMVVLAIAGALWLARGIATREERAGIEDQG